MIRSVSITDIIWLELVEGRFSFRINDMPRDIHFTISFHPSNPRNNFHVSKNVGGETDKPRIRIAEYGKDLVDEIMTNMPALVFSKIFQPVSFKKYTRRYRKNIRLKLFDEVMNSADGRMMEEKMVNVFTQYSTIKEKRAKIHRGFEADFESIAESTEMRRLLFSNQKHLTNRSFDSTSPRMGILFIQNKARIIIVFQKRCYEFRKNLTIYELLTSFMKPDLAEALIRETENAVINIMGVNAAEDAMLLSNPFQLFIEKVN